MNNQNIFYLNEDFDTNVFGTSFNKSFLDYMQKSFKEQQSSLELPIKSKKQVYERYKKILLLNRK